MESNLPAICAGVLLSVIVLIAFVLYIRGDKKTNATTWFILAYGDGLDFYSYFKMTGEELLMNLVPLTFAIGSIITFVVVFAQGRFGKLFGLLLFWKLEKDEVLDFTCLVGDLSITILWIALVNSQITVTFSSEEWFQNFDAATVANLGYQLTALIAFVPMLASQLNPEHDLEDPAPWLLWAAAFFGFALVMAYVHGEWEEMVYPIVNLFTHFMIGAVALTFARFRYGIAPR